MTWPRVIIFAVITAVYTAVVNIIPLFADTSIADIAITFDWWILFALFIIMNCNKWWEASLKCFVFFLISQPLIYLIEVPFVDLGWDVFMYYGYWFKITILTLPGAAIAYQLKRKDWLSVIVLCVASCLLAYTAIGYFQAAASEFPRHLLSGICALGFIVFYALVFFDEKKHRLVAIAIPMTLLIGLILIQGGTFGSKNMKDEIDLGEGQWTYTIDDESIVDVELENGNHATVIGENPGTTLITFTDENGETVEYYATITGGGIFIDKFEE